MKLKQLFFIIISLFSIHLFAANKYNISDNTLILPNAIVFDQHGYDLKDTLDPMLNIVAQYLKDRPTITKFRIEGHVYTEKNSSENMKLSMQRAAIISYYLTTKGIACNRLIPVAFGDTKPIAPLDECNINNNTRICFFNAELNHKAIEGKAVDGFAVKVFEPCE